ncbi:MAG: hypothetical protein RQ751_03875 [Longimicrobiales bacterium]|nr:hypothetical protein [Longimicrobiales bacterium]
MFRLLIFTVACSVSLLAPAVAQTPAAGWSEPVFVSVLDIKDGDRPFRDAVFRGDTLFVLTYEGQLRSVVVGAHKALVDLDRFAVDRPTSLFWRDGAWWVWDPVNGRIQAATTDRDEVVVARNLEDLIAGTYRVDGPARSNHLARLGDRGVVMERRAYAPQRESLTTAGFIIQARFGAAPVEDTLLRFAAWSFSKDKDGLILCCGNPALFTPQANWDVFGERFLYFTDGVQGMVLRRDLASGDVDSVATPLPVPEELDDETMLKVAVLVSSETRGESFNVTAYREQLEARRVLLSNEFARQFPVHTQLFALDDSRALIRHFSPMGTMGGLADDWSLVSFPADRIVRVSLPGLGRVLALSFRQGVLSIAHQQLRRGRYDLRISRYRVNGP